MRAGEGARVFTTWPLWDTEVPPCYVGYPTRAAVGKVGKVAEPTSLTPAQSCCGLARPGPGQAGEGPSVGEQCHSQPGGSVSVVPVTTGILRPPTCYMTE